MWPNWSKGCGWEPCFLQRSTDQPLNWSKSTVLRREVALSSGFGVRPHVDVGGGYLEPHTGSCQEKCVN